MLETPVGNHFLNLGGTIRYCSTQATLNRLKPLLKRLGITRVANVTGLDNIGIPVAVSIRPNAKHLSVSQGKGLNWELAQISAIMESIEGYHAENPRPPDLVGSYDKLVTNYPVIDPLRFNPSFFDPEHLKQHIIPWIEGIDLIQHSQVYLPYSLICLDSTQPQPQYSFLSSTSNGLAAGNEFYEAVCHGIYEIIERECIYRWRQLDENKKLTTQIAANTIDSTVIRQLLTQFAQAKLQIKIWDITSELTVPCFRCEVSDPNLLRGLGTFTGSGAHSSKEIALIRALTEAAQTRLTLITGSRDDVFMDQYKVPAQSYAATDQLGQKNFADCCDIILHSFQETVQQLLAELTSNGYPNVYVVNHTKAELNIPVVHVFIPGMQFDGARV